MTRTAIALASLAALTALVSSASSVPVRHPLRLPAAAGAQPLVMVGSRGIAAPPGKLDGVLADLARHASRVRLGHQLADLRALSPAARFAKDPWTGVSYVLIDAVTRGDGRALEAALERLGLTHPAVFGNDVSGFMPVGALSTAAARPELVSMRAAMARRRATSGPVATQGDFAQGTSSVRTTYPDLTGKGVSVGIISDSFDCYSVYAAAGSGVSPTGSQGYATNGFTADYASDVKSGALPANVTVVNEPSYDSGSCGGWQDTDNQGHPLGLPFSDEGRAMAQVVHAVAPGAALIFRTGDLGEADFASGIQALAAAPYGAKVIADDLGYFDEPFFQDGIVAQAIDTVQAQGVAYFSAAGNNQLTPSYFNTSPSFASTATTLDGQMEKLLDFASAGQPSVTSLPIKIPALFPGDFVAIVVQWDQPYVTGAPTSGGATSQIDICLSGAPGGALVVDYDNNEQSCSGPNALGSDPYQILLVANPSSSSGNSPSATINLQIGLVSGAAPGKLIVAVEDDGQGSVIAPTPLNGVSAVGPMLQGHPAAAGAAAVGAAFYFDTPACGTTPAAIEGFSAWGGLPILFDASGAPLATPILRQKPDFVGPDGINDTFLGFTLASAGVGTNGMLPASTPSCQNNTSTPNFFGTSAATPHAAGLAALMLQANDALTPTDVVDLMHMTAVAMPVSASAAPAACSQGAQPNDCSGYGFLQAGALFKQLAPGTPTLTLAQAAVAAGQSTQITWSSPIASSCAASGSWSGPLGASGSQTITPSVAGTYTYALSCSNANGSSATPASVKLTVTAADPPSGGGGGGGGGGGSLGVGVLCGLLALVTLAAMVPPRRRSALTPADAGRGSRAA